MIQGRWRKWGRTRVSVTKGEGGWGKGGKGSSWRRGREENEDEGRINESQGEIKGKEENTMGRRNVWKWYVEVARERGGSGKVSKGNLGEER